MRASARSSIAQLVAALDHAQPGLAARLNDTIFNFAVNDEMLTHGVDRHPIKDVTAWILCRQFLEDEDTEAWHLLTRAETCITRKRSKGR